MRMELEKLHKLLYMRDHTVFIVTKINMLLWIIVECEGGCGKAGRRSEWKSLAGNPILFPQSRTKIPGLQECTLCTNIQIDISMVATNLSTLQITIELTPMIQGVKGALLCSSCGLKKGKVRWLSTNVGLVANQIHKPWFQVAVLCPYIFKRVL